MTNKVELKPCPFCGSLPAIHAGIGTYVDIDCEACNQASVSIQISDLMTIEERTKELFENSRYSEEYVSRAMNEAIKLWNTRHKEQE